MPASAAAKGAEAKLRGSGASDSEGASASAVSAPFLSQLAVHKVSDRCARDTVIHDKFCTGVLVWFFLLLPPRLLG